jgi:hypothetical protein
MRASKDHHLHWPSPAVAGVVTLLALVTGPGPLAAEDEPSLKNALKNGKASVNLRYRWEDVRQDGIDKDAHASTLRTVLAWRSQPYRGFSLHIEAESVAVLGNDLYDNAGSGGLDNGVRDRPVVADPAGTEINQALVRYQADRWRVAVGRQEILLGDVRFVGNVGWRQNHQSFDALRIDNSTGGLRFTYAFADKVHRITGQSLDLAAHLFNAGFELQNAGKFTLYGYLLDYQDPGASANSTSTWGLEFAGKRRLGAQRSLLYEAEYATQSDYADNTLSIDADYTLLMVGIGFPDVTVKLARESLGEGGDAAFRTPLATLHKWNGWADKFLATPTTGLVDLYLQLTGKLGEVAWLVKYHDFESDIGSVSYGQELDLQLLYTCPKGVQLGLKGALYDADRFATDTDKWMVWGAYSF